MADNPPADDPEQRRVTTDPERIREWAEARDAVPVSTHGGEGHGHTFAQRDELDPGQDELSWDEFAETFTNRDLVFVYHDAEPTDRGLGSFDILEREEAFDRAALGRDELEASLREGETVTTEIVETQVVEREIVERDTIESEVVDSDVVERTVADSELLERTIVDTEFVAEDVITVTTDETRLETIEEIERYTIESRVVDVDIEQHDEIEREKIETDLDLETVQRSILESDVVESDVTADDVLAEDVIRSQRTEGDTVRTELLERRTLEEEVSERTRMRFTLEDTELLESSVIGTDVIEGEIIDVEEYGSIETTGETGTRAEPTDTGAEPETPTVDAGTVELSRDEQGKAVVDQSGQQLGIVTEVEAQTAYVDPEPGLADRLKARLGWGGHGDDEYPIDASDITDVTDDTVVIEHTDEPE
ncbi:hypothetical protein [Halopiger djelfimassiliensis]|uniref:hypothetical protein n=1 Tax=Halopiger djelfimassiliensis TaxID=1293047 RepID=UPI000677D8D3|nr:hypothetical protein [Halopiger djelfimassiliensis]